METLLAEQKITVREFLERDNFEPGFTYELINGEIVKKTSPHPRHQIGLSNLNESLRNFVREKKLGIVLFAPVDVFLDEENALVPDLIFISESRKAIITDNGVEGAPDLVVEILSPGTAKYDRGDKMKVYKKHRIPEYWLIDPKLKSVEIYTFTDNDYELKELMMDKGLPQSTVVQGFALDVEKVFEGI